MSRTVNCTYLVDDQQRRDEREQNAPDIGLAGTTLHQIASAMQISYYTATHTARTVQANLQQAFLQRGLPVAMRMVSGGDVGRKHASGSPAALLSRLIGPGVGLNVSRPYRFTEQAIMGGRVTQSRNRGDPGEHDRVPQTPVSTERTSDD